MDLLFRACQSWASCSVMFGGYLRPSESFRLRFCDLAKPLRGMGTFYSLVFNPSEVNANCKSTSGEDGQQRLR